MEEERIDGYCYTEECNYNLEDLGNEAWLTGCPMCGANCWDKAELYPIHDHSMSTIDVVAFLGNKGVKVLSHDHIYLVEKARDNGVPLHYIPQNGTFEIHPSYYRRKQDEEPIQASSTEDAENSHQ